MNKLENFLSRLDKVKRVGQSAYIACCPAHADKNPSMTIREVENGMILAHCFAGCSIDQIAGAVSMELYELMPDKAPDETRKARSIPFAPSDVMACCKTDACLLYVVMCDLSKGIELTREQIRNAKKAAGRIYAAAQMAGQ